MCKAFSCLVLSDKSVVWKFGVDSHTELLTLAKLKDDTADPSKMAFARCEISPKNGSYLAPDEWQFKLDQSITPTWWTAKHEEAAREAWKDWKRKLDKVLPPGRKLIHPFQVTPPTKITARHLALLQEWDSVGTSVGASVWDSVGDSVRDSTGASVWVSVWDSVGGSVGDSTGASVRASVWDSVWASVGTSMAASVWVSVGNSVGDSVCAYTGSLFVLPRSAWRYTEKIKTKAYPFESAVKLWKMGLVPSFDGRVWRLHGGKDTKVLYEISAEDLRKT